MIINNKYYSIVKTGIDDYKLTIKATKREIDFKRDINYAKEIQSSNAKGRISLIKHLKDNNLTKNDLVERKETTDKNGKVIVIYDDSTFRYLEESFINEARGEIAQELIEKNLKNNLEEILEEMNISEDEIKDTVVQFSKDFGTCMMNKTEETPRTIERQKTK